MKGNKTSRIFFLKKLYFLYKCCFVVMIKFNRTFMGFDNVFCEYSGINLNWTKDDRHVVAVCAF